MPVKAVGKKIIEKHTGKVVATAKSKRKAAISAAIRNRAIAKKK